MFDIASDAGNYKQWALGPHQGNCTLDGFSSRVTQVDRPVAATIARMSNEPF